MKDSSSFSFTIEMSRLYLLLFLVTVWLMAFMIVNGTPNIFRLGTVVHMTSNDGSQIFDSGSQRLSSFLLAVNDFNVKYGSPNNITVKYAVRDGHATYMTTAIATASLLTTAFPKSGGIQAIVGGEDNSPAKAIAETSNEFIIPQVSFGADDSDFSHGSVFPYFSRSINLTTVSLLFTFRVHVFVL